MLPVAGLTYAAWASKNTVVGVTLPVVFLGLVYVHCNTGQAEQDVAARNGPPGVELVSKLPRFKLDLELARIDPLEAEAATCLFCLEQFASGAELMVLPCFHRFHAGCVERWLQNHVSCPSCQCNVAQNIREQLYRTW
jgi:hypothetical protein